MESSTREYLARVYRISLSKRQSGTFAGSVLNEIGNFNKAEDYLTKYYHALKERVANFMMSCNLISGA